MFRSLMTALSCRTSRPAGKANPRCRLRVDALEDRCVPAIVVTTLDDTVADDGMTSLREAIAQAANAPGPDTITFAAELSGSINLSLGQLTINDSNKVSVEGANRITIDAGGKSRVMSTSGKVTLSGLTLTGGSVRGSGGGIFNRGDLTLIDSTVSNNLSFGTVGLGGGIHNVNGNLTLIRSTVSHNSVNTLLAISLGGGISNLTDQTLSLIDSTVSDNHVTGSGGGICSFGSATLEVAGSVVSGNTATSIGGGIFSQSRAVLADSTVSGNTAGGNGGGIVNQGEMTATDVTISGNAAADGGGILNNGVMSLADSNVWANSATGNGGGILNQPFAPLDLPGSLAVNDTSFADNVAGNNGGGLYNDGTAEADLSDCVFAGNEAVLGPAIYNTALGVLDLDDLTFIDEGSDPILQEV